MSVFARAAAAAALLGLAAAVMAQARPAAPRQAVQQAWQLHRLGESEEGLKLLAQQAAAAEERGDWQAWAQLIIERARLLAAAGKRAEAAAEARRVALRGQCPAVWRAAAARLWASLAMQAGDLRGQQQAYSTLAGLEGISPSEKSWALIRLGQALSAEGQWERAVKAFSDAEANASGQLLVQCLQGLARALAHSGDFDKLRAALQRARQKLAEQAGGIYSAAATSLLAAGAPHEARQVAEELCRLQPSSASGWIILWQTAAPDERPKLAERLAAVLREHPEAAQAAIAVASSPEGREFAGRLAEALAPAVEARAGDAALLRNAVRLALQAGRLDLAEAWCRKLVAARPADLAAVTLWARILARRGRDGEALQALARSAGFKPSDEASGRRLCSLLLQADLAGLVPKVVSQVRQATGNPSALADQLYQALAEQGKWGAAAQELAAAIQHGLISDILATSAIQRMLISAAGEAGQGDREALAQVAAALEDLRRRRKLPPRLRGAAIAALAASGDWAAAEKALSSIPESDRGRAALQAAQWLELLGSYDGAARMRRLALECGGIDPELSASIALSISSDLLAAGRTAEALALLRQHRLPGLPSDLAAAYDILYAELLLRAGRAEEAEQILDGLGMLPAPWHAKRLLLMAQAAAMRGDGELAAKRLAQARQRIEGGASALRPRLPGRFGVQPPDPEQLAAQADFLEGELALRRLDLRAAREAFSRAAASPWTEAGTRALARLLLVSALGSLPEKSRRDFAAWLAVLDSGDFEAAEAALPRPAALWGHAILELAAREAVQRPVDAAKKLLSWARSERQNPLAPYAVLQAAHLLAKRQPAAARDALSELISDWPDSALVPIARVMLEQMRLRRRPSQQGASAG